MALTLTPAQIQDWTAVLQNTIAQTPVFDMSEAAEAQLQIQAALDTETAHTGTRFLIFISNKDADDEDWAILTTFTALIGTANSELIDDNPLAAASTTITISDTTGYTLEGEWRFIEDGTLADSELVFEIAHTVNTDIDILNGTKNAHAQNTPMYNVAISRTFLLEASIGRIKVVVDNTYDDDGSTLDYKVSIQEVTDIR